MHIKAVTLRDFRNYELQEFTPSEGLNLIYGDNAQGKTNLLEAVFICAFGRSQRTVHDTDLIMHGKTCARVKLTVTGEESGEHVIKISLGEHKTVETDGVRIKKLGDLMGILKVVMFSPESLSLVKGSPSERRRFMDMCISQLSRVYFFKLQQYNAALKQRNALLKSPNAHSLLSVWDEQLAVSGAYIAEARERFVTQLSPVTEQIHEKLSLGRDSISVVYSPSVRAENTSLAEALLRKLESSRDEDIKRGSTGVGVHKDDISIKTNGLDSRTFASQGQQRTAALALRLSEIKFIKRISGENPVVLLDDVFSELDTGRCSAILECVKGCQCIFTSAQDVSLGQAVQKTLCKDGKLEIITK